MLLQLMYKPEPHAIVYDLNRNEVGRLTLGEDIPQAIDCFHYKGNRNCLPESYKIELMKWCKENCFRDETWIDMMGWDSPYLYNTDEDIDWD